MDPQLFHTGVGVVPIIDKVYDIKLCLTFAGEKPPGRRSIHKVFRIMSSFLRTEGKNRFMSLNNSLAPS